MFLAALQFAVAEVTNLPIETVHMQDDDPADINQVRLEVSTEDAGILVWQAGRSGALIQSLASRLRNVTAEVSVDDLLEAHIEVLNQWLDPLPEESHEDSVYSAGIVYGVIVTMLTITVVGLVAGVAYGVYRFKEFKKSQADDYDVVKSEISDVVSAFENFEAEEPAQSGEVARIQVTKSLL